MSSFEKKWDEIQHEYQESFGRKFRLWSEYGWWLEKYEEIYSLGKLDGAQEALQRVEKVTEELKWNHTMARGARVDKRYNLALDDLLAKLREEYK